MDIPRRILEVFRTWKLGKLLTPLLILEIDITMRYSSALKLMPYDWDSQKHQMRFTHRSPSHVLWSIVRTVFVVHAGLIWGNFVRSLYDPNDNFEEHAWVFFAAAAYSVPAIGQILITSHLQELFVFFNGSLAFCSDFEEKYWKEGSNAFGHFVSFLIGSAILTSMTQPYFIHVLYLISPFSKVFFVSSVFLNEGSSTLIVYLAALPSLWGCLIGWGTVMFFATIWLHFIYTFLFITQNITASWPSGQISDSARLPHAAFSTYRTLQILCLQANNIIQSSMLLVVDLAMTLAVVSNNIMIIYHAYLPVSAFIVFGGYSAGSTVSLFVLYIKLGELHHFSKQFVRSWKVSRKYSSSAERALMVKHFKSCRINRFEMGGVGYFQKPTSIRIVGKIIFYTTKFLMVMRPKTTTESNWARTAS